MSNKLELTWIGKEESLAVEPRLLIENPRLSNIEKDPETENMLIHGDNLLALKALEQKYADKVKCIYIDPPYNTGNAFKHYDDNLEHSLWLSLMKERLLILKILLIEDGVIFIQINDDEAAYLKVLCDEVFGRNNYETTFYVKVRHENRILREDAKYQLCVEQVFCYRKSDKYKSPRREKKDKGEEEYVFDIEILEKSSKIIKIGQYDVEVYNKDMYKIIQKEEGAGKFKKYQIRGSLITQKGSASEFYEFNLKDRREEDGLGTLYKVIGMGINGDGIGYRYIMQPEKLKSKNGFYFQGRPLKKKENKGIPIQNFYDKVDIFNNVGYEGYGYFNGGKKPEEWISYLLSISSSENDLVLDSFLGSGTTAAVAHKMNRRYIGIEMGEHAYTHCKVRLDKVIEGSDQGGISKAVNWQGGGGYKFYELAPTLINKDEFDEPIINSEYDKDMLASAVALHEGFIYSPDEENFWKQSKGSENSYLFVTTKHLTRGFLDAIKMSMKADEYLVIACKSFEGGLDKIYSAITIKKIPQMLLERCEFGKDNYNLNIVNPPLYEEDFEDEE